MSAEQDIVKTSINAYRSALERAGYETSIDNDFFAWRDFVASTREVVPNWTFNPNRFCNISRDGLFVSVFSKGIRVAVAACRVFWTDDFAGMVEQGGLWWPRLPASSKPTDVHPATRALNLRGVITHGGGGMILPDYRGRGLPNFLVRWAQLEGFLRWDPDWDTGVLRQDPPAGCRLAAKYGYPIEVPMVVGHSTVRNGPARLNLVLIDRRRILNRAQNDATMLIDGHRESLGNLARRLADGTKQAEIAAEKSVVIEADALINRRSG